MRRKLLIGIMSAIIMMPTIVNATETKEINMGEFKITYYCPCEECSDGWGRETALSHKTGRLAEAGRTVAIDPSVINLGDKLIIGDEEYIAEDTGGKIKGDVIDIYVDSHDEIPEHGVDYKEVWIIR